MKKRLIAILLVLVLCLTVTACHKPTTEDKGQQDTKPTTVSTTAETATTTTTSASNPSTSEKEDAKNDEGSTPLFYKITDQDGDVIWLLGSIHVAKPSMYPLPDSVMEAYEDADSLAVESDVLNSESNEEEMQYILSVMFYQDGTTLKDHVSAEVYEKAVEIMTEEGLYYEELDGMTAYAWGSLLNELLIRKTEYSLEDGIDRYLLQCAKDEGKPVVEVEDLEYHYSIPLRFSEALQELLLKSQVEAFDDPETLEELDEMVDVWRAGDEDAFIAFLQTEDDEPETEEERELYKEYKSILETERNILMTDYAESALEAGEEVFICVGAAHVVGEDAMVDLLTERGYTVELVQ